MLSAATLGWTEFAKVLTDQRVVSALIVSFGTAFAAACVNVVFGVIVAWVLVRYTFPGKRILDAVVDLPFALPTAVAGIALTALYAPNGWIGQFLKPFDIKIAFTPIGIVIALIFVGLPFIVRTVQPVMEEIDREVEEASATLGASRWQTIYARAAAGSCPRHPHRLRARLRARRRRIWLGDLHRRKHSLRVGNRAAADRHQA